MKLFGGLLGKKSACLQITTQQSTYVRVYVRLSVGTATNPWLAAAAAVGFVSAAGSPVRKLRYKRKDVHREKYSKVFRASEVIKVAAEIRAAYRASASRLLLMF